MSVNGFYGASNEQRLMVKLTPPSPPPPRPTALIWFLMAAESGFATAQFNVAYLCEHNPVSLQKCLKNNAFVILKPYNEFVPFIGSIV